MNSAFRPENFRGLPFQFSRVFLSLCLGLLYLYLILRTAATCILRSWGGRRLVGVLERIETPFRGSGGWWGVCRDGGGVGCRVVWGVGAPIETPFNNFNSPVSVRGGQAEEQGPQALEGNILLPTFFLDRCRLCSQGREKSVK